MLNMARLETLVEKYSPNLTVLTLDDFSTNKEERSHLNDSNDDSDDSDSDTDDSSGDEELKYLLQYGNVWESDAIYKMDKWVKIPPFMNIHTIRIVDELVSSLFRNMFVYQLFKLCPNVRSASNFGKAKEAFKSLTFDFVRAVLNK